MTNDKDRCSNYKAMSPVTLDWWWISTLLKLSTVCFCRGNWIGEAPYQHGRPCSQCPPSYGGGCRNNQCYKGEQTLFIQICQHELPTWILHVCLSVDSQRSETEDMNEVEKPQVPLPPRTTAKPAPKPKPSAPKRPVSKPTTPKPSTPKSPSSKTPISTFLGSYRNDQKHPQTFVFCFELMTKFF